MAKEKKPTFEEALARLEEIVAIMEDEKCPLDEALARYEEGIKLVTLCAKTLDEAEKKIEILTRAPDGAVETRSFPPEKESGEREEQPAPLEKRARKAPVEGDELPF